MEGIALNRYNQQLQVVKPAQTQTYASSPAQVQQLDYLAQPAQPPMQVDTVFVPQATVRETATPVDRSHALLLRLLPITLVWLVLAIALAFALHIEFAFTFVLFAALTWWSYYTMDGQERYDSATGVEHHRIDAAERLASQKMEYDAQLRREITQAYLKQLEGPKP